MSSVNSRTFSWVTIKTACIQVMIRIKDKLSIFWLKGQFFLQIANYPSFLKQLLNNKIPDSQQWIDLQEAPFVQNVKLDRCILSFYISITTQQQFVFPIIPSIHTHSIYIYIYIDRYIYIYPLTTDLVSIFQKLTIISLCEPPFPLARA